ncbi:MAG TPA: 2OG-Fe(II) oxygenase [Pyrinomonadaceae bacterium]|nr:2OG-Fe(II) oxygenase [Pyrinomonadaceae bacterium]
MIRLTKSGPVIDGSDEEVGVLREQFERRHWIALPNFLDQALSQTVRRKLDGAEFLAVEREIGSELRPADTSLYFAFELLLNSPEALRLVPRLTGCAPALSFSGRIYRRLPGGAHFNRWHSDVTNGGRMVALSVNLSERPYEGGGTQLREAATGRVLCELANTGFGDAIMFRIDPSLEHRVMNVTGREPKTALAGWFRSKYDPESLFGRGPAKTAP